MIRIKQGNDYQTVTPTMFPDGTSQVWKLDLEKYNSNKHLELVWDFEQEVEIIWLNQLVELLFQDDFELDTLYIPYLPYARQDKLVTNETTFAKKVFVEMLPYMIGKIVTLDCHSDKFNSMRIIENIPATQYINRAIRESTADVLVFPDKGYKTLNQKIGLIYGDSITLERCDEILKRLEAKGFASDNVVFGIGSYTYQMVTRDTLGFAMKATNIVVNGEEIPLFKDPKTDTDKTKKSAKGLLSVHNVLGKMILISDGDRATEASGLLTTLYKDGEFEKFETLVEIRERLASN